MASGRAAASASLAPVARLATPASMAVGRRVHSPSGGVSERNPRLNLCKTTVHWRQLTPPSLTRPSAMESSVLRSRRREPEVLEPLVEITRFRDSGPACEVGIFIVLVLKQGIVKHIELEVEARLRHTTREKFELITLLGGHLGRSIERQMQSDLLCHCMRFGKVSAFDITSDVFECAREAPIEFSALPRRDMRDRPELAMRSKRGAGRDLLCPVVNLVAVDFSRRMDQRGSSGGHGNAAIAVSVLIAGAALFAGVNTIATGGTPIGRACTDGERSEWTDAPHWAVRVHGLGSLDSIKDLLDCCVHTLGLVGKHSTEADSEAKRPVPVVYVLVQRGAESIGTSSFADGGDSLKLSEAARALLLPYKGKYPALAGVMLRDECKNVRSGDGGCQGFSLHIRATTDTSDGRQSG